MVERTVDCNKMREDVAWFIYLYLDKHEFFFSISPLRKQSSPEVLLLIYSLVFTTYMQCKVCAKKMCLSCIPWGKGLENSFRLILSEKNFSSQQHNSFPFVTSKCCCLAGKYWKAYKVCNFFVYKIDEIAAIFSNLESGALPILTQTYYVFPL